MTVTPDTVYRDYETDGVPSSGNHEPVKSEIRELLNDIQDAVGDIEIATGEPYVIAASGQSNIANNEAFVWDPPANLFYWNATSLSAGTVLTTVPDDHMRVAYSFAAEFARRHPNRPVYLVNVGEGSNAISHWLPGTSATDMYAALKAGIEALLSHVGLTKIDHLLWWQGESDYFASSVTYAADFQTVFFRWAAESWFPRETPITIMAVSERYNTDLNLRTFNNTLRRVVDFEPMYRTFVDTRLLSADCWELPISDNLHMTGDGYRQAGITAYLAAFEGYGQARQATPWQTAPKRVNEARASNAIPFTDKDLKVPLRSGKNYRVRFRVFGETASTPGFKWSITGPAATLIAGVIDYIKSDTANTTNPQFFTGSSYPTGQQVLPGSGTRDFSVWGEFVITPTTADGELTFKWAQNTSNAANTYVFAGSAFEIIEMP